MGTFVFDYGYGQGKNWYTAVKNNSPTGSAFVVVALASTGLESDATLKVKTDLAALLSGTTDEATNTGYARKVLVAADIPAVPNPDTTNHWWQCTISNPITWTGVANDGTGAWGALVVCYRPAAGSADSAIIPLTMSVFTVTPNGGDVTATPSSNGFYRAGE